MSETVGDPNAKGNRGELEPGGHLGKYRLERVLGQGGMGVVWAAHDPDLERSVAVKVLRFASDASNMYRTRLLREARAMARLKHPNVLTVYEVGSDGDRDYIVMELVDGTTLHEWLATKPSTDDMFAALLAAGRGLAAAHAAGLVHRDFKPHNVLRSRDGRVLVTDFGLARGTGDDTATAQVATATTLEIAPGGLAETLPQTASRPRPDAVLDSTLTRTGALLGTPAYMAPEQWRGAAPDPRTDQFAFCVAAWEALAGASPLRGKNLEELRRAAEAGIGEVRANLPGRVRAVLARGLDIDADARWPNLDVLLDALARARPRRFTRRQIALAIFVVVAFAALVIRMATGRKQDAPPAQASSPLACGSPEGTFGDAWTPARRAMIASHLGDTPAFHRASKSLDALRSDWLRAYNAACAVPTETVKMARLTCLLGERDEVATFARLLETISAVAFERLDMWGQLPRIAACETDSPVSPPLMPEDPKVRDRIVAVRARMASQLLTSPLDLLDHLDDLRKAADATGWKPLEAEVAFVAATAAQLTNNYDDARTRYELAIELADLQHDYRIEATARIGLLEIETYDSAQPEDAGRAARMIAQVRLAVQRAGDDPALALAVDGIVANIDVGQGRYTQAIPELERTRKRFLELGGFRQANVTASTEIDALVRRDSLGDLDTAWQIGTGTQQALEAAGVPVERPLARELVELAWRRGDLESAHARADRLRQNAPPTGASAISGRVVTAEGKPAAGAHVVAWQGELIGDATRAYTLRDFAGDIAIADASGNFTVQAPPHGALVAELGTWRSSPSVLAGGTAQPVVLRLAGTRTLAGQVHPGLLPGGFDARVVVVAGGQRWVVRTPVAGDGSFTLAGVPAGARQLEVEHDGHRILISATGARVDVTWPPPTPFEILLHRPGLQPGQLAYVLRGKHDFKTRTQLDAAVAASSDVAILPIEPIGFATRVDASKADQMMTHYVRGDHHVVLRECSPGTMAMCVAVDTGVSCTTFIGVTPRLAAFIRAP